MRLTSKLSDFRSRHDSGKILISLALVAFTLMAFAGLAIDMGRMEFYRRRIQAAADSGAVGGARELQVSGSTNVVTAAKDDVTTNGYTNNVSSAGVTVNFPPASGPHAGNNGYVEVVVTKPYPTTFLRAINISTMNLKARAVGGLGPSDYCILALDPTAPKALEFTGSSVVNTPGCAIMDDSSNGGNALYSGNSDCVTAKSIDVVGSVSAGSGQAGCNGGAGPLAPTPKTGATYVYDPLAYLSAPSNTTCNALTSSGKNGYSTNKTETLSPGVYCGGIKISGNNNTITFSAGTYILLGGGLQTSGGGTVQGTGITFYNTGNSTYSYNDFTLNGNTTFHLSAPTTGGPANYEGILYFQDRTQAGSSTGDIINGTNSSTFDGVFYAADGHIQYTGNSSVNGYTSIIADTITFTGSSVLKNNYSGLSTGNPVRNGALME
jgi:Flp pilus assembly protein TadG